MPDPAIDPERVEAELTAAERSPQTGLGPFSLLRGIVSSVVIGAVVLAGAWALAGLGGVAGIQASNGTGSGPRVGGAAPDFEVRTLDGSVARLSDFRGQPVWLSFWATWCPPCRAESSDIEALYQQFRRDGVVVLAVDVREDMATIEQYLRTASLTYPVGLDPDGELADLYRVVGLPNHFFIDPTGVVRERRAGPVDADTVQQSVAALLAGPGAH